MIPILKGINNFVSDISMFINLVLLTITYIFGVGLTYLVSKIFGKIFLETRSKSTYWNEIKFERKINDYYKQY